MRKTCFVGASLCLLSVLACAQEHPTWEIYGGYQFVRADFGVIQDAARALNAPYGRPNTTVGHRLNLTGANVSLQRNFAGRWGGIIDIGSMNGPIDVDLSAVMQSLGYIPHGSTYISTFQPTLYTATAGPQFTPWRSHKLQPFLRAMGGMAKNNLKVDATTRNALNFLAPTYATTTKGAAVIVGGGAEYPLPLIKHVSLRVCGDYIVSFLPNGRQTYLRATGGLVFRRVGRLF